MPKGIESYRPPVMGVTHAVSAGHSLAAAAGYRILEDGGNAVDAGVASGIAINVTLPAATFGGVAPIIIYEAKTDSVVTISELGLWPRAASIDYFNENAGGEIPRGILRMRNAWRPRRVAHRAGAVRDDDLRAGGYARPRAGRERIPGLRNGPVLDGHLRHVAIDGGCLHAERTPTGGR